MDRFSLSAANIGVAFKDFTLGPISISIERPLSAVVGPSGAGKTTLLSLLAGLYPAETGTVLYGGNDIAQLRDAFRSLLRRRHIAVAMQQPYFFPEHNIADNIVMAEQIREDRLQLCNIKRFSSGRVAKLQSVPFDAIDLLRAVGLEGKHDRRAKELSGGELSRANIARAFARSCDIVFLDEPTAMLDQGYAEQIRSFIVEQSASRRIVVATHDEKLIAHADPLWKLENGKIHV